MANQTLDRTRTIARKKGYVTQLKDIVSKNTWQLERSLGFGPSGLAAGYQLYLLLDHIRLGEFQWKDSTRYSAGWAHEYHEVAVDDKAVMDHFYADRHDQLRHALDAKNQRNMANGLPGLPDDWEIDQFMRKQTAMLNVQRGPARIVKVVSIKPICTMTYPNASERNIRQWDLRVAKNFIHIADIGPGKIVQLGMFDAC